MTDDQDADLNADFVADLDADVDENLKNVCRHYQSIKCFFFFFFAKTHFCSRKVQKSNLLSRYIISNIPINQSIN
jgi:hypothetical protein